MVSRFSDVARDHGLLIALGRWLFQRLWLFMPTYWWNRPLARRFRPVVLRLLAKDVWDDQYNKSKPVWQDIGVLILLCLTLLISLIGLSVNQTVIMLLASAWSVWILLDIVIYFTNTLWFYDIEPGHDPRVWSHRRILFQAFLSYCESVLLFAVLYRNAAGLIDDPVFFSFLAATTLSYIERFNYARYLWHAQIAFSLFFIVVIFMAVIAHTYRRGEIASDTRTKEEDDQ